MKIEITCYDKDISDEKLVSELATIIEYKCDAICVLPTKVELVKSHLIEVVDSPKIATAINFPGGNSFSTVRAHEIVSCCKRGTNIVDLTLNMSYIRNSAWKLLKKDLQTCVSACNDHNVTLRAMIEYRMLDDKDVLNLVCLLQDSGIDYLINTTGTMPDDTFDNVIMCKFLLDHSKLHIIASGRIFTPQHERMFVGLGLWAIRFKNTEIFKNVYNI